MKPPHFVFITCDQLRADLLGCAGHPLIQTPHIDLLAKRGIRFTQAYSPQPVCIPARATIMTGLEGHRLGITTYKDGFALPVNETMPRQLGQAGYQTKVVGKMHVYPERCHYGFDQMLLCEEGRKLGSKSDHDRGYDDYEAWLAEQGYAGQAFGHGMSNNEYATTPWHLPDHLHPTEWIGTEACKAIKQRDWTRPLFLWTSFTAPHPPLTPLLRDLYAYERDEIPEPALGNWTDELPIYLQQKSASNRGSEKTRKQQESAYRAFYALTTQVDRQINRIYGTLREEGILDHTWFVFTADHGDSMGDHGIWGKSNLMQGSCRIPFIICPPYRGNGDPRLGKDWVPRGSNDSPVGLQDIMPTVLDIAGAPIPEGLDGKSLLPLFKEQDKGVRDHILGEFGLLGKRSIMITDGAWKYIWFEQDGRELLFHIINDPNELVNLSLSEVEQCKKMKEQLHQILSKRENDPAVTKEGWAPIAPVNNLTAIEIAKMANDGNPRGLH